MDTRAYQKCERIHIFLQIVIYSIKMTNTLDFLKAEFSPCLYLIPLIQILHRIAILWTQLYANIYVIETVTQKYIYWAK